MFCFLHTTRETDDFTIWELLLQDISHHVTHSPGAVSWWLYRNQSPLGLVNKLLSWSAYGWTCDSILIPQLCYWFSPCGTNFNILDLKCFWIEKCKCSPAQLSKSLVLCYFVLVKQALDTYVLLRLTLGVKKTIMSSLDTIKPMNAQRIQGNENFFYFTNQ